MKIDNITLYKIKCIIYRIFFMVNFVILAGFCSLSFYPLYGNDETLKKVILEEGPFIFLYGLTAGIICVYSYIVSIHLNNKIEDLEKKNIKRFIKF